MIIYNKRTRIHILKKILEKEFQRKYNWKILLNNNFIELIPYTDLQKFILSFKDNLVGIECKCIYFQKKIKDIHLNEIRQKIYQLYLQSILIEYFMKYYQQSIKSLYDHSFFHLSTHDLKSIREIF